MSNTAPKPRKPSPKFRLFGQSKGQWCKTTRARLDDFSIWNDPQATQAEYRKIRDDLQTGR